MLNEPSGPAFHFVWIILLATRMVLTAQTPTIPSSWTGTWVLDRGKSTLPYPIFVSDTPVGMTLTSQRLRIEFKASEIAKSGDTVLSDRRGTRTVHDESSLDLNGKPTHVGPVSLLFRRADDLTFEVLSTFDTAGRNLSEVSRYQISADGKTLTETKTRGQALVQNGQERPVDSSAKVAEFVLVFTKAEK